MIETTDHRPSYLRRVGYAFRPLAGGTGAELLLVPWLLIRARNVTGDVSFRTVVPIDRERAHALVKDALLAVCRTRVLAKAPKPITASCYYGEFTSEPLTITFSLEPEGVGTRIDAVAPTDGRTNWLLHERKRSELRRLMEFIERSAV